MSELLFRYLPRGGSLPCSVWQKRHQAMVVILTLHIPALFVVGVATHHDWFHVLLEVSLLALCAMIGLKTGVHRNVRMVSTSVGLLTASALLVHFSGGVIEMHFHFFVMVAAITLYQAWLPFLVAIAYVVGQHGVMGVLDAASVYNHPAAVASPWKWAVVHGMFILGECVTLLIAWRLNEDARAVAAQAYEKRLEEEAARREAQAAFGRIFENSVEGIYESSPEGAVLMANPALARIMGYDKPEDMLGVSFAKIHYAKPHDRELFLEALKRDGMVSGFEFEARRTDGSSVWLSNNARAVTDEFDRLISVQGMVEDISKRKESEAAREDLEAQLRQAQKMEAVGQLAGGVAHDFNNLLSIIQNYAHFSMNGLSPDDARSQDLQEVLKASRRGADLVRQLMAFSRRENVVGVSLDLNEVVHELGKMLTRTLGEDIALSTDLAEDLWSVEADPGHTEQILMNLVLNARDAMEGAGEVHISTSNYVAGSDSVEAGPVLAAGRYVALTVTDNGCGMEPEVRERVFEPFFTTKGVGSGTGLGLATVYGIVEHWNGSVTVESEPGEGTSFSIYLPVVGEAEVKDESPIEMTQGETGRGCVLVVEDEPSVLELVRRILSTKGYDVFTADSAPAALELAAKHDGAIDLFLSDMVMPGTSGKELSVELQRLYPDVPVVFMSGYSDDVLAKHGTVDPALLLPKPFSAAELLAHVRRALGSQLAKA